MIWWFFCELASTSVQPHSLFFASELERAWGKHGGPYMYYGGTASEKQSARDARERSTMAPCPSPTRDKMFTLCSIINTGGITACRPKKLEWPRNIRPNTMLQTRRSALLPDKIFAPSSQSNPMTHTARACVSGWVGSVSWQQDHPSALAHPLPPGSWERKRKE